MGQYHDNRAAHAHAYQRACAAEALAVARGAESGVGAKGAGYEGLTRQAAARLEKRQVPCSLRPGTMAAVYLTPPLLLQVEEATRIRRLRAVGAAEKAANKPEPGSRIVTLTAPPRWAEVNGEEGLDKAWRTQGRWVVRHAEDPDGMLGQEVCLATTLHASALGFSISMFLCSGATWRSRGARPGLGCCLIKFSRRTLPPQDYLKRWRRAWNRLGGTWNGFY